MNDYDLDDVIVNILRVLDFCRNATARRAGTMMFKRFCARTCVDQKRMNKKTCGGQQYGDEFMVDYFF
jgi:hypothetical protein